MKGGGVENEGKESISFTKRQKSKNKIYFNQTWGMIIKRNNDFYTKKIKGRWIILEKNKRFVRELNEIGSLIRDIAEKPVSIKDIVIEIFSLYNGSEDKIRKDVKNFINKYLKEGFLIKVS